MGILLCCSPTACWHVAAMIYLAEHESGTGASHSFGPSMPALRRPDPRFSSEWRVLANDTPHVGEAREGLGRVACCQVDGRETAGVNRLAQAFAADIVSQLRIDIHGGRSRELFDVS